MSDIKLFSFNNGTFQELKGQASDLEKPLQLLIEKNLETLLGIRFLSSEYSTGKTHAGRIDTLGIDENDCPVILEYKRSAGENVINQGLFYLDWLMDHQAEFKLLVLDCFGNEAAAAIDWTAPRLICIAADFTKYDQHAVLQMNRNIELIRYRLFGKDLLLLELVNAVSTSTQSANKTIKTSSKSTDKPISEALTGMSDNLRDVFDSLEAFLMSLGDDVQRNDLKLYIAFKRIKNFCCVEIQKHRLVLTLKINPDQVMLEEGFSRDVRTIGHWGTGDLEIWVSSLKDFEKAKDLLRRAYLGE